MRSGAPVQNVDAQSAEIDRRQRPPTARRRVEGAQTFAVGKRAGPHLVDNVDYRPWFDSP
jgi:hypothetical protein